MYNFQACLEFSKGVRQQTDLETIKKMLFGCKSIYPATAELDKQGIDYVATLRGGAEVYIDAKTRTRGCSKYWKGEPEVAIEKWSVFPSGKHIGKAGWTLDESKKTDLILYTWDPSDSTDCYLVPFQHLRMASRFNINQWMSQYKCDRQCSGTWESEAVFVPISVVLESLLLISHGNLS